MGVRGAHIKRTFVGYDKNAIQEKWKSSRKCGQKYYKQNVLHRTRIEYSIKKSSKHIFVSILFISNCIKQARDRRKPHNDDEITNKKSNYIWQIGVWWTAIA